MEDTDVKRRKDDDEKNNASDQRSLGMYIPEKAISAHNMEGRRFS
jgi:hypothetical protein